MKFAVQAVVILFSLAVVSLGHAPAQVEHGETNIIGVQPSHDLKQIKIKFSGKAARPVAYIVERPYRLVVDFESTGVGHVPAKMTMNRGLLREIRTGSNSTRARVVLDFGENPVPPFNVLRQSELVILNMGKNNQSAEKPKPSPEKNTAAQRPPLGRSSEAVPSEDRRSENMDSHFLVKGAGVSQDLIFVEIADRKDPKRNYRLVLDFNYDDLQLRTATFSDALGNVKRFDMALNTASGKDPTVNSQSPLTSRKNWAAASGSYAKLMFKKSNQGSRFAKKPRKPTMTHKGSAGKNIPKPGQASSAK
ncbi:MAG: AMIN domain-containing protein [Desulfomonilaceae bacterium]